MTISHSGLLFLATLYMPQIEIQIFVILPPPPCWSVW